MVSIGILGESVEIQFFAVFIYMFKRDLSKFEITFYYSCFHWNIRGKLRNPVFGIILYRLQ